MKLVALLMLAAVLQVSAKGFAQEKISIAVNNAPLEQVLNSIKKQSGFYFVYRPEMVAGKTISIRLTNATLKDALDQCLKPQKLAYNIVGNSIVISPSANSKTVIEETSEVINTPIDVKGRVLNENGDPMEGVTVVVKGSSQKTITDKNGEFSIITSDQNAVLLFSHVSMEPFEIKVDGRKELAIRLKSKVSALDEMQVIAYGTTTRRLNTGNVATVKSVDIQKQPVANPLEAISGRMAGVYIQQTTGTAGAGFNIEIRGLNSLRKSIGGNNGNLPLYIVDGVQISSTSLDQNTALAASVAPLVSPLNTISPSDIESIEVLKDADATAIYGSRGANGVVIITTKKGKSGKTKVDVNFYTGAGKVVSKMDLLSAKEFMQMRHQAFANDGVTTPSAFDYDLNGSSWDTTTSIDWQKTLIGGTSHITRADASLSGGNQRTQFLFGAGYFRQTTVFPGDFVDKKGSVHFNLNHSSENKRLNASLTVNYVTDKNNLPSQDPTATALSLPPVAPPVYNSNGTLNWANNSWVNQLNPLVYFLRPYDGTTNNLIANSVISYDILPGLQLRSSFGYNNMQMNQSRLTTIASQNPANNPTGMGVYSNQSYNSWVIEPQLEYQRNISKGHLNVLIGSTFQQNLTQAQSITARNFTSDAQLDNPGAAPNVTAGQLVYNKYRYNAVFGRITYNWDTKYLVNLTGRRDGSSRFGPGKQFANFGAVGLGWIFSNESFFNKLAPGISYGKIRASYGITGNDQIPDYGYLNTYTTTAFPYNGTGGLLVNGLFNADFAWESNKKAEAGLELGFINDRILFSTSFYRNRSSNQLVGYPLPTITGQPSLQYYNLPAVVQNVGWEFELRTVNFNGKKFNWTTSLNLTIPRNELIAYPDIEKSSYANTYEVGKSIYVFKGYHYTGIDPNKGVYTFEDIDKSTSISNPNDLTSYKNTARQFFGGLTNSFKYKNLQLDVFFQFVKQNASNYLQAFQAPGVLRNQPTWVLNAWQDANSATDIQKYTQAFGGTDASTAYSNMQQSDAKISDASFIRLKNVYLSYQMPSTWLSRIKVQSSRLYLQGQNLVTITNYMGLDPETLSFGLIPPLRLLTAGIQITL